MEFHCAVTVVVTVTVRKGPMIGTTVFPAAVGAGADLSTIEKAPKGIVTPGESPVAAGAKAESVVSEEALGTWIVTEGVSVRSLEGTSVTKFCALAIGVTVVEASDSGKVRLAGASETAAGSGTLWTTLMVVVAVLTVTVSGVSNDEATEASTGVERAVSDGIDDGMVVVIVVDMRRVTVSPAGIEGLVAGSGTVVGCSCPAPATGSTVVVATALVADGSIGASDPGIGTIVVVVA